MFLGGGPRIADYPVVAADWTTPARHSRPTPLTGPLAFSSPSRPTPTRLSSLPLLPLHLRAYLSQMRRESEEPSGLEAQPPTSPSSCTGAPEEGYYWLASFPFFAFVRHPYHPSVCSPTTRALCSDTYMCTGDYHYFYPYSGLDALFVRERSTSETAFMASIPRQPTEPSNPFPRTRHTRLPPPLSPLQREG